MGIYTILCVVLPYIVYMQKHYLRGSRFAVTFFFSITSVYLFQFSIFKIAPSYTEAILLVAIIGIAIFLKKSQYQK